MSQPHTTTDLWFVKDPTRKSTYTPGQERTGRLFAWFAVGLGTAILGYIAFEITNLAIHSGPVR